MCVCVCVCVCESASVCACACVFVVCYLHYETLYTLTDSQFGHCSQTPNGMINPFPKSVSQHSKTELAIESISAEQSPLLSKL